MAINAYDFQQSKDKYNKKAEFALATVLRIIMGLVIASLKVIGQVIISILQMIGLPVGRRSSYY